MLCNKLKSENELNVNKNIALFPKISDRDFWENAKEYSVDFFEKNVRQYDGKERKHLTATLYRQFYLNGDRVAFEKVYFARRAELVNKIILECFYNDGRYTDDIVDLVWMILEETTWTVPAHIKYSSGADSLPVAKANYIDLFSAETACVMAFAYQVFGEKLDEISVNITPRIKQKISEHLEIYLKNTGFFWMGYYEGARPNNWNPWINSNILACAMIIENDEERLRNIVYKIMTSLDFYYDRYPADGACDEGPSYWNQAGLSMLEDLWLLYICTDGQINFFGEEKVHNTLEFFMKYDTGDSQAVNFADAGINVISYYASLYKMGKLLKNNKTIAFSHQLYKTANAKNLPVDITKRQMNLSSSMPKVFRMMDIVTYSPEMDKLEDVEFEHDLDYYLDSIQVVTSRFKPDAKKGLFLAAKGGHNDEHHNHNDVGNFIVYKNGTKFLIDSGNMQYRKETFGELRYTLRSTRSAYHNVPMIDGTEQKNGIEFAAKNAKYKNDGERTTFSIDIADAYPDKIIEKWMRTFEYNKPEQKITVTEDFVLNKECEYSLNFLTPQKVERCGNTILLSAENGETLEIALNRDFDFEVETVECEDHLSIANWGERFYRISIKSKAKEDKIAYIIK